MTTRCLWVLVCVLAFACSTEAKSKAPSRPNVKAEAVAHTDEPAHEELPTRVKLSAAVITAAGVRTQKVSREILAVTVALPGEIVADPDRSAHVASPVAGRIERVSFKEGSVVKQGEPLAVIRVPALSNLRSTHAAGQARARAARANAERLAGLVEKRLAAQQTYVDALAAAEALEVEVRAAADQIGAMGLSLESGASSQLVLRAPLSGTVLARNAVVGHPVTPDGVIAEIVDLREVWFLGRVFEKDLSKLHLGERAEVTLNAFANRHFVGEVEYIGRQVDPTARTVTTRVRLKNEDESLRVGLFGMAHVVTDAQQRKREVIVVPRSALTDVAGKSVVFVRQADGDFELHEVVLGESADGKVEIVNGLREGEQVVVEGLFTLKSAVLKSTIAEDD